MNVSDVFSNIKSNITGNYEDSEIKISYKSNSGYSDIIFKKIKFTELGFKKLYNCLNKNQIENIYINYDSYYREIVIEQNKFKIQSNSDYLLQFNLSSSRLADYETKLKQVLTLIDVFFNRKILCDEWNNLFIKLNDNHQVKIVKNDTKEVGLLINDRLTIRQFYDASRKKTYINFHGEYFASCLDKFREKFLLHDRK